MAYVPLFSITPTLLTEVEQVAALRERIQNAVVDLAWIPALQKDTRTRNVHASTAIEGNPLTLEQVRALEEGRELSTPGEIIDHFAPGCATWKSMPARKLSVMRTSSNCIASWPAK